MRLCGFGVDGIKGRVQDDLGDGIVSELVTIVIPVYKVEQYLDKCISSVRNQTYSHLEIILVDDGSPDNCGQMCDMYAASDDRIVVIHKENGGLSDARNAAINIAKGEYITFVDSDDFIHEDYIEYLYSLIKKYDADMSICEFDYITEEGQRLNHPLADKREWQLGQEESLRYLLRQRPYSNSVSGKLFRTADFSDIRFPYHQLYEDTATVYKLFLKSEKVVFGARPLYFYVARNGSISNSGFSVRQMDALYNAEKMVKDIVLRYPQLQAAGDCRLIDSCVSLLRSIQREDYPQEYNTVMECIRQIRKTVLFSKEATIKRRLFAMLAFLKEKLFVKLLAII